MSVRSSTMSSVFLLGYVYKMESSNSWLSSLWDWIKQHTHPTVFLSCFHCSCGHVFSEWCYPSHQILHLSILLGTSQERWKWNRSSTVDTCAGETHEWRTRLKHPPFPAEGMHSLFLNILVTLCSISKKWIKINVSKQRYKVRENKIVKES